MAYADISDIEGDLNGVDFSESTSLSESQVTEMIEQESAVIDQYLSAKYETPVTDSEALKVCKKICVDLVVHRVAKVLEIDGDTDAPDPNMYQSSRGAAFKNSRQMLRDFASGALPLNGASIKTGKTEKVHISPSSSEQARVFKKDEVQW